MSEALQDVSSFPVMNNKSHLFPIYRMFRYGRVLELGPFRGYDTVHLCRNADSVVCLEARQDNIARACATLESVGLEAEMVLGNLEDFDLSSLGMFDAVWASGVFYPLPDPLRLIDQIALVTERCFGWTHLANQITGALRGYPGMLHKEAPALPLSGMSGESWILSPRAFKRAWAFRGWNVDYLTCPEPTDGDWGLEAQFIAWKGTHLLEKPDGGHP